MSAEDIALAVRAKAGDAVAFEELYRLANPRIRQIVGRMVGNRTLADDLCAAVWEKVVRRLSSFAVREGGSFQMWVNVIARRVVVDYWRSPAYRNEVLVPNGAPTDHRTADSAEVIVLRRLTADRVRAEVANLVRADQRTVVRLHGLQGLSQAETAEALGTNAEAVKQLFARGRRNLRRTLGDVA